MDFQPIQFGDYARVTYTKTGDSWLEELPVDQYEKHPQFELEYNPRLSTIEKAQLLDDLIQKMHMGPHGMRVQDPEWEQLHVNLLAFLRDYLPLTLCDKLITEIAKAGGLHQIARRTP